MENENELKTIYSKQIDYNNLIYLFSIQQIKSKSVYFILTLNEIKYEKVYQLSEGSKNDIINSLLQNINTIDIVLNSINKNKAEITIKLLGFNLLVDLLKVDKEKEIKSIFDYDYDELIKKCNEKEKNEKLFSRTPFNVFQDTYIFRIGRGNNFLLFSSNINVKIIQNSQIILKDTLRTNYEIKELLAKNNIDINKVFINNKKLADKINVLYLELNNNELILEIVENKMPDITIKKEVLDWKKDYYPKEYSEFFYDYFKTEKKENELFIYENNDLRNEIHKNVMKLFEYENIKKYMITGPYACGKSMTIFRISRITRNIIYINLKTLKDNVTNKDKCIRIILSECLRIDLNLVDFKKKYEKVNVSNNIFGFLIEILEIIIELSPQIIILILDQYKSSYFSCEKGFMNKINNLMKKNLKLVICSSINDNEIRDAFLPTLQNFYGNPPPLEHDFEDYYYYYFNLYNPKCTTYTQQLFGNRFKYIEIFEKATTISEGLTKVSEKIIIKIGKFKKYEEEKYHKNCSEFNLDDILIFLNNNMNKDIPRSQLNEIVSICPLKFFIVDIKEESFNIVPLFPFIKYCFKKYLEKVDCDEYFKKEKYKSVSFLSNSIKGEYFEFSVKKAINDENLLRIGKKNFMSLKVNEICKMKELVSDAYQEIIDKLNENIQLQKDDNENIKEEEEEENDISEESEEDTNDNINNLIKDKNNRIIIEIKLRKKLKDVGNYIENKISKVFKKCYPSIKPNENIKKYEKVISSFELRCLKDIYDFKNDEINNRIEKIKKDILKSLESGKTKKKKIFKLPISNITKNYEGKFTGDENIFIDQDNKYGKLLDYAALYGKKNNKIFVGFQIKCYSQDTQLEFKFKDKWIIKNEMKRILLDCKDLFNCEIKNWHYFLIFYFNKDDDRVNNLGIKTELSCIKKDIAYLLYDPKNKHFLNQEEEIIQKLELSDISNLDNDRNLEKRSNFIEEKEFFSNDENINYDNYKKKIYWDELSQFSQDFNKYGKSIEEILENLGKIFNVENLFYSRTFKSKNLEIPSVYKIFLYHDKNNLGYISIVNDNYIYEIYEIINKKHSKITNYNSLDDLNDTVNLTKNIYILSFYSKKDKKVEKMQKIREENFRNKLGNKK